jgi:hypothetical protein
MELSGIVDGVIQDLRRAGAIGGDETARVADLLAAGLDASLRLHILEALNAAAREIEAAVPGLGVEVRLEGREPVLTVARQPEAPAEEVADGASPGDYADGELLRLTIRLPQGLKSAVEQAASGAGASINSWIVSALARTVDNPGGRQGPGRRLPRRMTGFVQG